MRGGRTWLRVATVVLAFVTVSCTERPPDPDASVAVTQLFPQDYADIRQLHARLTLTFGMPGEDGTAFARNFTDEGVLIDVDGTRYQGRAELAALARRVGEKTVDRETEFTYNEFIEPAPGGASAKSYVVMTQGGHDGEPVVALGAGQYHESLVRTAEGWQIASRTFVPTPTAAPSPSLR